MLPIATRFSPEPRQPRRCNVIVFEFSLLVPVVLPRFSKLNDVAEEVRQGLGGELLHLSSSYRLEVLKPAYEMASQR